MVLPTKKRPFTKEDELLKKKLKKLFKYEDLDNEPNTSNTMSTNEVKPISTKHYKESVVNASETKISCPVGIKRRASLKNVPGKKMKKSKKKYETESSLTTDDSFNKSNCAESSDKGEETKKYKNNRKSRNKSDERESSEIDESCCHSNTEDSEEFEELEKVETKKKESRKSKMKSNHDNLRQKGSNKQNENSKNGNKKKTLNKSENKLNKREKYSGKDYSDSTEYLTDDSNGDYTGPGVCSRKYRKKNARKSNNDCDVWKTEPLLHFENDEWETDSEKDYSTNECSLKNTNNKNVNNLDSDVDESIIYEPKVNKNIEKVKNKGKKNQKSSEPEVKLEKFNGKINHKLKKIKTFKEAGIIARKNKETNQTLVPYRNSNSNLPDSDSAEEDIDEMMQFYGLESTDEDYDVTEEESSFSNFGESDFDETDSENDSFDEECDYEADDDSEYDSDLSNVNDEDSGRNANNDYNFESESSDEDYNLPENCEEDLYIPQGIAIKYDMNGYNVEFDSENEAQIIEIPIKSNEENIQSDIKNNDSDDSCPQLVPISFENTYYPQNMYDFSETDEYSNSYVSDCCSEYSEATEGSLCYQENLKDKKPLEATKMLPEIFDLSSENLQNTNSTVNGLDIFDSENSEMDIDNPEEKIINKISNITNAATSYKVTTVGDVEVNNTSKLSQQKILRRSIKYNISNEFITDNKFETKFYNAIDSCHVLVLLRDPIFIYGTIKLKLIAGNIEIFGYQPDLNETLEIFSPRGYSFLDIKSLKNKENIEKTVLSNIIFQENYESIFLKFDLNDIIESFNSKSDALILLTRNDCNKQIEMLRKYMKENLFPNMNSITLDRPFYASEFILHCLIRLKPENSICIDPKWQTIKIKNNTKSMIIGGKSVGKSTLIRYLINKNLKEFKKMLLIDLDIGQPELFIPQTLSVYILDCPLLGPGYYLGLEPKKSLIVGDINAILAPNNYLNSIQILLKYCLETEEFQNIPWILNTMGYVKGFGNELIAAIIKYLQPTDIIQLQSSKPANNFDYLMYPNIVQTIPMNVFAENDVEINHVELKHHLILFDSIINGRHTSKSSEWDMKPKDMRYAMIVTRLGAALNKFDWLTDVKPVCASIDDVEIISFGEDYLTKEELLDVMNANLVYLCNKSANTHIDCYGIGIVRGIDRVQRKIYLLPAVPIEILTNVNCFAICNIPLPTSILLNQGPKVTGIIPYAYNTNKVIGSKSVHQLYNRGQKRRM